MKNKNVGYLVVGIGVIMGIIVFLFDSLLKDNLELSCGHGPSCGMYQGVAIQTWISFAIVAIIVIVGFVIMLSKPEEKIIVKTKRIKEKQKKRKIDLSGLNKKEKDAVKILQEEGVVFQKDLMERLEIGKVGMTRLLDKLESREVVERKRRGMNNVVVLRG